MKIYNSKFESSPQLMVYIDTNYGKTYGILEGDDGSIKITDIGNQGKLIIIPETANSITIK